MVLAKQPLSMARAQIAVVSSCATCRSVPFFSPPQALILAQINGTRSGAPPLNGGANIEMGGPNSDQLIEYVHSFDPRSWSCLHVAEGSLNCNNATVQNNDIGPAGSDLFQQWADGISVACANSLIRNNMINNPTDGGIVLFGAPGTRVENNTIWVETVSPKMFIPFWLPDPEIQNTLLGGINMVDVAPWNGDYKGVVVTNNSIAGGFASQAAQGSATLGTNNDDVVIKYARSSYLSMLVLTMVIQNWHCDRSTHLVWARVSQQCQHWRDSA